MSKTPHKAERLTDLTEAQVLARIFPKLPTSAHELLGPGDDAAVVSAPDGRFVVTTDMMVEGPDFRLDWSTPFEIGYKAAAINLADVAVMGARPTSLVVALGAPGSTNVSVLEGIADGLRAACEELAPGCGIVGGDLSSAPSLVISIAAHGDLAGERPVTRSGAVSGDRVAVIGELGLAGLGLALLFREGSRSVVVRRWPAALAAQVAPRTPIAAGLTLPSFAHAAMDVSDGLALDALRLARASGVVIELDEAAISAAAAQLAHHAQGADLSESELRDLVVFSGESHAILFTAPPTVELPPEANVIGCVRQGEPQVLLADQVLAESGWHPFAFDAPPLA